MNPLRWSGSLLCAALLLRAAAANAALASANLDQARNGTAASPTSPVKFQNGNAGAANSHYMEGQSIPYRMIFDNLTPGVHTVRIEWDIRKNGKNALDYITGFDRLQPHQGFVPSHKAEVVNPLAELSGTFGAPKTFPIPAPSSAASTVPGQPSASFNSLPAGERALTMYNGVITSATYLSQGSLTAAQSSTRMKITFTALSSRVVLAWGGHIASKLDWGAGNSATGINGSPYHTRLIDIDGWGGNQDRSLTVAAIVIPSVCDIVVGPAPVCGGSTNTYSAVTTAANATFKWSITGTAPFRARRPDPRFRWWPGRSAVSRRR